MSARWRNRLAKLVTDRLGIELRERQLSDDVQRFVMRRADATGAGTAEEYVDTLARGKVDAPEFSELVRVITVAHSFFFRDDEQLATALRTLREERSIPMKRHLWSACCSTGQEAYSMVMLAIEAGIDLQVTATDINPDVIKVASEGLYTAWAMRSVDRERKERFFEPVSGGHRLKKRVRERVSFTVRNLFDGPPSKAINGFDLILCRNAFIYFTPEARAEASRVMARSLNRRGWLFLGASETLRGLPDVPLEPDMRWGRVAWRQPDAGANKARANKAPAAPKPIRKPKPVEPPRAVAASPPVPTGDAITALRRGHDALQRHDFDRALEAYSEAQALNPLLAEVHYCEGVVHRKGSDLPQAAAAFRRALFLDPDFWPASFLLAGVYRRQDQLRRAARQLRETLRSLDARTDTSLFRSHVDGIDSLALDAQKVRHACTRMLS